VPQSMPSTDCRSHLMHVAVQRDQPPSTDVDQGPVATLRHALLNMLEYYTPYCTLTLYSSVVSGLAASTLLSSLPPPFLSSGRTVLYCTSRSPPATTLPAVAGPDCTGLHGSALHGSALHCLHQLKAPCLSGQPCAAHAGLGQLQYCCAAGYALGINLATEWHDPKCLRLKKS